MEKIQLIRTGAIIKEFTEDQLRESTYFEISGPTGAKGWGLTKKAKAKLAARGYVATNLEFNPNKKCSMWIPSVIPVIKKLVLNELENTASEVKKDNETVVNEDGGECEVVKLLRDISCKLDKLIDKWS